MSFSLYIWFLVFYDRKEFCSVRQIFFVLMLFGRGMEAKWVLGYYKSKEGLGARKIDFAPAFYILAVFFQMSESDALQESRNICPVITQVTDNELQAFPRGVTEIGCLSIASFMREVVLSLDCSYSLFPLFGISPFLSYYPLIHG